MPDEHDLPDAMSDDAPPPRVAPQARRQGDEGTVMEVNRETGTMKIIFRELGYTRILDNLPRGSLVEVRLIRKGPPL